MTTIIACVFEDGLYFISDLQLTLSNIKIQNHRTKKLLTVGSTIVGGAGELGQIQQMLKIAQKEIFTNRIESESYEFDVGPKQLASELANSNWFLNFNKLNVSPFDFLLGGYEREDEPLIICVSNDASQVEFDNYFAIGSGFEQALASLQQNYNPSLKGEKAVDFLVTLLRTVSKLDLYTNDEIDLISCKPDGQLIKWNIEEVQPTENCKK